MKQKEHLKEWRKKNYFGGFESSEESSLSYKSIESQEVDEHEDATSKRK